MKVGFSLVTVIGHIASALGACEEVWFCWWEGTCKS